MDLRSARKMLTLDVFLSRQDMNEDNGQSNIQQYDHTDHNCIWPLKRKENNMQILEIY